MSISSQLPPIPLAQAGADLRALALAAGQTVEARVLAQSSGGTTQVMIGRQTLNLQLPAPQPPGTVLTLSVQQAEGQLRLSLVSAQPATTSPVAAPPASGATNVQLSAAALSAPGAQPQAAPAAASVPGGTRGSPVTGTNTVAPAYGPPRGGVPVSAPSLNGAATPTSPPGATPMVATPLAGGSIAAPAQATGQPVQSASVPSSAPSGVAPATVPSVSVTTAQPVSPAAVSSPAIAAPPVVAAAAPAGVPSMVPQLDAAVIVARPAVPYAAAPVSAAATATALSQPVQQTTPMTSIGQHASAPGGPNLPPASPQSAATPASPQAALNQMVHAAAPRQDSVLSLTAAITAIAGKVAMPEPVAKAMQQVLAQRLQLDGGRFDGAGLQKAVQQSGIFQEAMLAAGQPKGALGDMKSSLLGLQRQLLSWIGNQAPVEQVSNVPPPLRGQVPRAKAGNSQPRAMPQEPQEAGKVLLERTEAALSRLRLHQHASLPEPATRSEGAQWSLDLPVIVGGQQALLQMQIHRDAEKDETRPEDRGWQVRFAINLDEAGEVGAQISLRGSTTGVLLWADRAEIADLLSSGLEDLREELSGLGLAAGAVIVRAGSPAQIAAAPSASGHFVDATR